MVCSDFLSVNVSRHLLSKCVTEPNADVTLLKALLESFCLVHSAIL